MILRVLALAAALTRASAFEDIKCKWLNSKGCLRVSYCELKGDKCTDAPQAMVTCADGDEIPDDCLGLGKVACKKLKKTSKCRFSKATKVCARKGGALSCATVAGYSAKKREKECAKSTTLAACPAACGTCVPPCAFEDSETWQWKKQTCATMAKKKKKNKLHKACKKKDKATKIRGHTACPLACGRCFEETPAPTDAPTPKPSATPTPGPTSAPTFDDAEGWTATGAVNGVAPGSTVIVTLGSAVDDSFLATRELAGGGAFEFQDLNKSHDYFLKWEGIGYKSEEATVLSYASSGRRRLGDAATPIVYDAEYAFPGATEDGVFHFSWTADASRGGSTEYANVPNVTLEILGEAVETINDHAAGKLEHKYGIVLSNDGDRAWSTEQSFRLLQTLDSIPQRNPRDVYAPQNQPLSR